MNLSMRIFLLLSILAGCAFGATNWTGTTSQDWTDNGNWNNGAPTSADLAVVYGNEYKLPGTGVDPVIFDGTTAQAMQFLLGNGDPVMLIESGASLTIGTSGASTGYVAGNSVLEINGIIDCTGWFGVANSNYDPGGGAEVIVGHVDIYLNDPAAELNASLIQFGLPANIGGVWTNTAGTGVINVNAGTVTTESTDGLAGRAGVDRLGFNISSASNGAVSFPDTMPAWWWIDEGHIVADSGYGVVVETNSGGRTICTARAYDPAIDDRKPYNIEWDNGGATQSVYENWNYGTNELPWPGDLFVTTGKASYGSHPVVDNDANVAAATIGWQPVGVDADDYIEVQQGVVLDLSGLNADGPKGRGRGDLTLGANGQTFQDRGMGTLILNGGTVYCRSLNNGSGDSVNWLYGDGQVEMNGGYIDCNSITMSIPDAAEPNEPYGQGGIVMNGGTINITDTGAFYGIDTSKGIVLSGDAMIIIQGDMDALIGYYESIGKVSAGPGFILEHDYNVTYPGKTTVMSISCEGDLSGDCYVNIEDIQLLAGAWLDGANGTPVVGDSLFLQSAGAINPGLWSLGVNNNTPGAYLPAIPSSGGFTFFNDPAITPNPNIPLVGDINGDGISDIVVVGSNGAQQLFEGRNTATSNSVGDLVLPPMGTTGWPDNFVGTDINNTDFFLADVDGDGDDDAVTRKPTPWDGGTTSFWEAWQSDGGGIDDSANNWAEGVGTYADTPVMGDFNGDGAADIAEIDSAGNVLGLASAPGSGLNAGNPAFWGFAEIVTNHIATLVGDINGDGKDDFVNVDDRASNGNWTWVAHLTADNGAIPAGVEIGTGGLSWIAPFELDANSTKAVPMLADVNNDGRDDLVLYEEYVDQASGNIWSRVLASYTDDPAGGLFTNGYDEGVWYDWVGLTGAGYSDMIPVVGNVHPENCDGLFGDINSDCRVNFKDFARMADIWLD